MILSAFSAEATESSLSQYDTLQRKSQGQVVPDSFTHGSAEQRKRWFSTGFKEGNIKACNTFAAARL